LGTEEQRLIYVGKQLEDEKQLCDYGTLSHGSTLFLVMRLHGGSAAYSFVSPPRRVDPSLPRCGPKEHCMITMEQNSPETPVLRMPCRHPISPDGLMDYCWNEISGRKKYEIRCSLCNAEWPVDVVCKYGCVSATEKGQLEIGLSNNYCLSNPNILECPSCTSFCERMNEEKHCVMCRICSKKTGKPYHFCWQCLREWKNDPSGEKCGNPNCDISQELLLQLSAAPMVTPSYLRGSGVKCPNIRACVNCGTLIELLSGCKHMQCKRCGQEFCFSCLRQRVNSSWACGDFNTPCTPAPKQTRIPKRNK